MLFLSFSSIRTRFLRHLSSVPRTVRRSHSLRGISVIAPMLFSLLLCGCEANNGASPQQFDTFLDACFQEYVSADTVTQHFKLSDPSAFGITENVSPSFGEYSVGQQEEFCRRSEELLRELLSFHPDTLSEEDAFTWEILKETLEASVASEEYILYQSPFGTNGIQSQIPVTLSEYYFDDEKDIRDYLALVNQIPELFDQLLIFEQQRREAGIVSPDFVINNTIDQITQFLAASEDEHLLIETFEEKIEHVPDLSGDQKRTYINNNRSLVRQVVLPAFASLRDALEEYAGDAPDSSTGEGLCRYDRGKEYYELLLSANVGTSMTPEECIEALEELLQETTADIGTLTKENPQLYSDYLSAQPSLTDTQEILTELERDTRIDFPEPPDVSYVLKNVPDALSSTSASAFYLLPPIDSTDANIIYINQIRVDSREQFSTLAHEGYPGHLYQTNYYRSTEPEPIRFLLRCDGYDEGWGTYAQLYSYHYLEFTGTDRDNEELLQQLYRDNDILSLSLSCLSDLYVHYEGYTEEELAAYLSDYGVEAANACSLYEYVIENPTGYLSYGIGWYELEQLRNTMEKALGRHFDSKEFHKAVLSCGSCTFSLLAERVASLMSE